MEGVKRDDLGEEASVPESKDEAVGDATLGDLRPKIRERRLSLEGADASGLVLGAEDET